MVYLTCTMIFSIDLTHYRVSGAKDLVSDDCGTSIIRSLQDQINFMKAGDGVC